jgi:hypothetical protein
MTYLSDDSLCIQMSGALRVEMKLEQRDSIAAVVVRKCYSVADEREAEVVVSRFDANSWKPLSLPDIMSSRILARDRQIQEKPHF